MPRAGPRQRSGFFEFLTLCRGPTPWPSAKKFSGFFKNSLPRAGPRQRNGFLNFLTLCRGPTPWPSAKKLAGFFKNSLPRAGPRQRNGFLNFFNPLPRAYSLALGKEIDRIFSRKSLPRAIAWALGKGHFFAEGLGHCPRQRGRNLNFFFVFCIPSTQAFHIYTYIYHTEPIFSQYMTTIIVNHKSQYITTTSHMFIIIHMFITTS